MAIITFKSKVKNESNKDNNLFKEIPNSTSGIGSRTPDLIGERNDNDYASSAYVVTPTKSEAAIRIGLKNERIQVQKNIKTKELGTTIGNVTVFEKNANKFSFYGGMQGKDIKSYIGFLGSNLPRISINSSEGSFDNVLDFHAFGQGSFYRIYDENFKFIPFRDFSKLIPKDLIGKQHVTAYPFVNDLKVNFEQFVDPSISAFDGAVDVLSSRQSLIDNDIRSFTVNSFKGELMQSSLEYSGKGSIIIDDKRELREGSKDYFLDSQESFFKNNTFPQIGVTGSSGKTFGIQGYSSADFYISSPFKDLNPRDDVNEYTFLTTSQKELLLTGSDRSRSEIGERYKAANRGFFFGESNALGTDSISFGGLKK